MHHELSNVERFAVSMNAIACFFNVWIAAKGIQTGKNTFWPVNAATAVLLFIAALGVMIDGLPKF
jgi:hypothetical protein